MEINKQTKKSHEEGAEKWLGFGEVNRKRKGPLWQVQYNHRGCEDGSDPAAGSGGTGGKDASGIKVGRAQAAELRGRLGHQAPWQA